ncbi:hypothetical protein T484DRAFT_1778755, partial [Baffinella frigidus]
GLREELRAARGEAEQARAQRDIARREAAQAREDAAGERRDGSRALETLREEAELAVERAGREASEEVARVRSEARLALEAAAADSEEEDDATAARIEAVKAMEEDDATAARMEAVEAMEAMEVARGEASDARDALQRLRREMAEGERVREAERVRWVAAEADRADLHRRMAEGGRVREAERVRWVASEADREDLHRRDARLTAEAAACSEAVVAARKEARSAMEELHAARNTHADALSSMRNAHAQARGPPPRMPPNISALSSVRNSQTEALASARLEGKEALGAARREASSQHEAARREGEEAVDKARRDAEQKEGLAVEAVRREALRREGEEVEAAKREVVALAQEALTLRETLATELRALGGDGREVHLTLRLAPGSTGTANDRAAAEGLAAEICSAAGAPAGSVRVARIRPSVPAVDLIIRADLLASRSTDGAERGGLGGEGKGVALGVRVVGRVAELLQEHASTRAGAFARRAVCLELWGRGGAPAEGEGKTEEEWVVLVEAQTRQLQEQNDSLRQTRQLQEQNDSLRQEQNDSLRQQNDPPLLRRVEQRRVEEKMHQVEQALEHERLLADARDEEASSLNFDLSQARFELADARADADKWLHARFELADARAEADKWRDSFEKLEVQMEEHRHVVQDITRGNI